MKKDDNTNLLYISYYWPPSGGPGVQRGLKFCKYLPQFQVQPTVLTVDEKQASYPLLDPTFEQEVPKGLQVYRTATSEPFEYYKKLSGKKEIPFSGFANQKTEDTFLDKVFKFVRGNLFIPDARVGWNKHALKKADELLRQGNYKAILTTSPPHSSQLIGLKLKKKYNLPWIADLRDPWTNIHYYDQLHHTTLAKRLDEKYERQVLEQADAIIVTSEDTKRLFLNKPVTLDVDKIHVIPNGYDEDDFKYPSQPPKDTFLITYTGTITESYNIDVFLKVMAHLMSVHSEINYKLRFVGQVSDGLKKRIEKAGVLGITEFIPYVPHQEAIRYLMESTILLLAIADVPIVYSNVPGKLFEYLASNKHIVCLGPVHSDTDHIIDECGAGRLFHYTAYDVMLDHMTQTSKAWKINPNLDLPYINHKRFSRRALSEELAKVIKQLVNN
ncbi:glycosyltransferase involved in cell wall biosynthesis [Pontibacter ummariensis]|uniref:Glycosyltransferase involved in cell wall bisynthesis n=1 Tax=Pontibacter ummariensis TaxID=1610492 RepID=A0A239DHJ7_9BACT|nr:glycosyltransferase family 4 protein [Pontibacter ummariensis]PRY14429.1 glycosyltransferase involved in cell wall biosynthesis [Pontibacter ummariensis]SNS31789.1 Glycosyltransferase involved in cell wall bisynthesis [Pontibacter ummariensis]